MLRTSLICLVLIALLAFAAHAVEPAKGPDEQEPPRELQADQMLQTEQDKTGTTAPFPRQFIVGKVTDIEGTGLRGTSVKLFANGELVESATTDPSGEYELDLPLNLEKDETVDVWFVPATDRYMMQCVVLKKSSVARQHRLFSSCVTEAPMHPQMRVDVSLMTEEQSLASIKARGCY
jgi:hypothetical protein